jgi:hypothetical protein
MFFSRRFGENCAPVKETLGGKKGREVGGVYWRQYFWVFGWLSSLHFGQASWVLEWDKMQNTQVFRI